MRMLKTTKSVMFTIGTGKTFLSFQLLSVLPLVVVIIPSRKSQVEQMDCADVDQLVSS